ncbi:MAG: smalltalk protein [Bacteroidales bacterium]|nr:smalltalk protein [Bacteroidales bacterium]
MNSNSSKLSWVKILQAVVQAIVAALTALGVSSCVSNL